MVSAIAALQASLSSGTNGSSVRLEPGTEVRAKVEANLPNNVLKLSVGSSTIEVRANASLPQGTELTLKVTGEPGKTQIQLLPDSKPAVQQPAQSANGAAAQASGTPANATDPATVQRVIQAASQQTAQLGAQTTANTSAAPSASAQAPTPTGQTPQAGQTAVNAAPASGQAATATSQSVPQASQVQAAAQQAVAAQASQTASAPQPLPQGQAQTAPAPQGGNAPTPQQPAASGAAQPTVTPGGANPAPQAPAPSVSAPTAPPLPQTSAQAPATPAPSAAAPAVNSGPAPAPAPAGNLPGNLQIQSFEAQAQPGMARGGATVQNAAPATVATVSQAPVSQVPVSGAASGQPAVAGQPAPAANPSGPPAAAVPPQTIGTVTTSGSVPSQAGTPVMPQGATPAGTQTGQVPVGSAPASSPAASAAPVATPPSVMPSAAAAPQAAGTPVSTAPAGAGTPVPASSALPPGTVAPTAVFANVVTEETVTGGMRVSLPTSAYSGVSASQGNASGLDGQKLPVSPQLKQAADTVMPKLAEQQASLANLFAQLGALTGGQSQAGANLPEPVKQVMQQILGLQIRPDANGVSAKQVEAAVKNSGLFREAGLLRQAGTGQGGAQSLAQATDLKSLLINLRGLLQDLGARSGSSQPLVQPPIPSLKRSPHGQRPASTSSILADGDEKSVLNRLAHDTDAALSRVRMHQMVSRGLGHEDHAMQGRSMDMTVDLPIMVNGQTAIVQMQVGRDPEGSQGEDGESGPGWRLRFALDLTDTGPMEAAISLRGGGTYVSLWVDRGDTLERLNEDKEQLEAAFAHAGLDLKELRFLRGLPRRTEARFGAMVDRQS